MGTPWATKTNHVWSRFRETPIHRGLEKTCTRLYMTNLSWHTFTDFRIQKDPPAQRPTFFVWWLFRHRSSRSPIDSLTRTARLWIADCLPSYPNFMMFENTAIYVYMLYVHTYTYIHIYIYMNICIRKTYSIHIHILSIIYACCDVHLAIYLLLWKCCIPHFMGMLIGKWVSGCVCSILFP